MKKVKFCNYAQSKFTVLAKHKVFISRAQIKDTVTKPDKILPGHKGRKIAQKFLDEEHLLRVIFEETEKELEVVTFYPARRRRYED